MIYISCFLGGWEWFKIIQVVDHPEAYKAINLYFLLINKFESRLELRPEHPRF